MEPASCVPRLSSGKDLRRGQKEVLEHFRLNWNTTAQLPTGYGKTLTGAACYKAAREAGKANRLLWIVPRNAQASQAAEALPSDLMKDMGVSDLLHFYDKDEKGRQIGPFYSWDFGARATQGATCHRLGRVEIFVCTVQALMSNATADLLRKMMSTGLWMVVVDESHHYGDIEASRWVREVHSLPYACRLAMSATPERTDKTSYFGDPNVRIGYGEAARREKALKRLHLSIYDYTVDVTKNGEIIQYTCDELIEALGANSDFSDEIEIKMAERDMRWSPKYVSPLIERPLSRLIDLRTRGIKAQMLVQALSCSHAKVLADQISALVPDGMKVEWVGTGANGRDPKKNEQVINDFCPPKDQNGRRNWTIDILVNVGIAGEGLDTVDVCEVVFCTKPRLNPTTLQTMGRAARLIPGIETQPVAFINVDKMSPLREYYGFRIMDAFEYEQPHLEEDEEIEERERKPDEYEPMPNEPVISVVNVELTNVLEDPMFQQVLDLAREESPQIRHMSDEESEKFVADLYRRVRGKELERFNGASQLAKVSDQVNNTTRKLAGLVMKIANSALRPEKTQIGDIMKRINSRRKFELKCSVKEATVEQARAHYEWNKQLEQKILQEKRLPLWLV